MSSSWGNDGVCPSVGQVGARPGPGSAAAIGAGSGGAGDVAAPGRTAVVTNVQRFSLHDGPGLRTVLFLKGCPFRCPWCSNPENLSPAPELALHERLCIHCSRDPGELCPRSPEQCPTGAKELLGERRGVGDVAAELLRDRTFFEESGGGVTVSGGECLLYQGFLAELLEMLHEAGVATAIETTLAVPLEDVGRLAASCDLFLVDFKVADRARSLEVAGIDPDVRDANLRVLLAAGAECVARMPIIPGYTDGEENVAANLRRIRELGIRRVDVLPFHQLGESKYEALGREYDMGGEEQLADDDVGWVARACERAGLEASIRG